MPGIKLGTAGLGSMYANHCAMLPPLKIGLFKRLKTVSNFIWSAIERSKF